MGVENGCKPFLLVVVLPAAGEYTRDLGKDADGVHGIEIGDDVAVGVLLEQERADVGLSSFHHFFDGGDDGGVADDDGFVEAREERATGDGQCEDLRVYVGHGLFCD